MVSSSMGGKQVKELPRDCIYRRIAARSFKRSFGLADRWCAGQKVSTVETVRIVNGETGRMRRIRETAPLCDAE
jgi:hypothetical protein